MPFTTENYILFKKNNSSHANRDGAYNHGFQMMVQPEIPIMHWVLPDLPSHKVKQPSSNPLQDGGDTSIIGHYQGQRAQISCTAVGSDSYHPLFALILLPQLNPLSPGEGGYLMTNDGIEKRPNLVSDGLAQHAHSRQIWTPDELQPHLNVALKDNGERTSSWWSELQVVAIHLCGYRKSPINNRGSGKKT